ncbi:MAG: ATP-binding protein [Balneolaceae bacterium]
MSNPKKRDRPLLFQLGIRMALWVFLPTVFILSTTVSILWQVPYGEAVLFSLATGLLLAGLYYLVSLLILRKRLEIIYRIVRNISRKRFGEHRNIRTEHLDELDSLVTRSIRAGNTMEREIMRLNKIENYRKEFIGDISHELKTPTFAIQGFIETLLDGAVEDPNVNRTFLKKAMRNVNRLIFLTKDLMEISRLETGELKSNIQEIQLRSTVLDVVESLQHKAQSEQVEIRLSDGFDRALRVRADRNQIKQVLINLIENGMKYNRPGGYVEIGHKSYSRDREKILLYIKDSGVGIEPGELKRVTERFYRVDKSRSREKGGTGLGLSIVKHIIEAHGEELFIESRVNEGSTFSFTLTVIEEPASR